MTPVLRRRLFVNIVMYLPGSKSGLGTPYQEKKKKRELTAIQEESSSTVVDPALVTVVAKDRQDLNQGEASSTPTGAKSKKICSGSEESGSRDVKDKIRRVN